MTGGRPFIFTDRSQGKRIAGLIRSAVLQYENPPTDEKALSICCYNLLLEFVEGGYTHDLEREELYKRYVEPVMKEIENNYSLETDRRRPQPPGLYHPPVPGTAFRAFPGVFHL